MSIHDPAAAFPQLPPLAAPAHETRCSAEVTHSGDLPERATRFLKEELDTFGLNVSKIAAMIDETYAVIGGDLMTNVLAYTYAKDRDSVKPLMRATRDLCESTVPEIDIFVGGCIPPPQPDPFRVDYGGGFLFKNSTWAKYDQDVRMAARRKREVCAAFDRCIFRTDYKRVYPISDEEDDDTNSSSCIVYARQAGAIQQKLNLVFLNMPIYTAMSKMDLSLNAGFLTHIGCGYWMYHHAVPADIYNLEVHWMHPEITHTSHQRARMEIYCRRYNYVPNFILSPIQFIAIYDDLPEKCTITLCAKPSEKTPGLMRRVRGMSEAVVVFAPIAETAVPPIAEAKTRPNTAKN